MFDWDPKQAARNLDKHGVTFFEAASVFADPDVSSASRTEATREGIGYQTLIHRLLAEHVKRSA